MKRTCLAALLVVWSLTALGLAGAWAADPVALPPGVRPCCRDLAKRLNVPESDIKLVRADETTFPDASLGLPRPGEMYAQVLTPGRIVILAHGNFKHLYTATNSTFRYGGPTRARTASALYLEPIAGEPNLNGNLVQVSAAGTNPTVLIHGVSDFHPQLDGSIIALRRTSRSGHDLLYLAPGSTGRPIRLASAFAFGDAAVDQTGKRWVAYSRPMVGMPWQVRWGTIAPASATADPEDFLGGGKNTIALPDDGQPGRIYWHMDNPAIGLPRGGIRPMYYELLLNAEKPEWRKMSHFFPPANEEFMLSKSDSLVVETQDEGGKPVTHISSVWFTGDERRLATIPDFTVLEQSLVGGAQVFLFGKRGDHGIAFTVSFHTGQVLTTVEQTDSPVRGFLAPPRGWIWSQLKEDE